MRFRRSLAVATCAVAAVGVVGCGGAAAKDHHGAKAKSHQSVLGSVHRAKGSPVLFGAINIETQQSANFPEVRQAANAMVNYLNTYRDGLDGHPIKVKWCITDGTPSVSSTCAKQLVAAHPVAILGAADLAAAATLPIYAKAHLVSIGGTNFTPPQNVAKNSLIFTDVASFSNYINAYWAAHLAPGKGAKVAVLAEGDTQGEFQANTAYPPTLKSLGKQVKVFPMPPSASDLSASIEAAISWGAKAMALESPGQCVQLLTGLKTDGWTGPITSIDPCSAPPVIKASGGAANGMYFPSSVQLLNSGTPDAKLAAAVLKKYAPANIAADSPALEELGTVMNIWTTFHKTPIKKLTSSYMLKQLRSGKNRSNFLSESYTCSAHPIKAWPSVCNAKYYMYQIKNGSPKRVGNKVYAYGAQLIKS